MKHPKMNHAAITGSLFSVNIKAQQPQNKLLRVRRLGMCRIKEARSEGRGVSEYIHLAPHFSLLTSERSGKCRIFAANAILLICGVLAEFSGCLEGAQPDFQFFKKNLTF
jgi:hypothetical protein